MSDDSSTKPTANNHRAELVFEGVIFSVYQWQQQMYDGSYHTFERLKRNDSACILAITEDNKIIITHQQQPSIPSFDSLVGGIIEAGEDPQSAARRELMEETGYDSTDWQLWFTAHPSSKIDWTLYVFIARNCKLVGPPQLDNGEKIELELIDFPQFLKYMQQESFRDREVSWRVLRWLVTEGADSLSQYLFRNTYGR